MKVMMKTRSLAAVTSFGLVFALGLFLAACPASLDDRCSAGACDSPLEGGSSGGGETSVDAGTDPCLANPTADACIDDSKTIFVSGSTGSDTADGGHKTPFKTLGTALQKITSDRRRIYVCDGNYPEDVSILAAQSRVTIIGGFTCSWTPSMTKPIFGKTSAALKILSASGVAISDLAFQAADAATGSSIAAFIAKSEVTFQRVNITAGNGANGLPGKLTDFVLPTDLVGNDGGAGGATKTVICPAGDSTTGGAGGASGFPGTKGAPGATDNGGILAVCGAGGTGLDGAPGLSPMAGPGATKLGALTDTGWVPQNGMDGAPGVAGQGGGGGTGAGGGTGGSGGAGGCGGAGGKAGAGGGASLAVAALQSAVRFTQSVLTARRAGAGGAGVAGQVGKSPGGDGGMKTAMTTSCPGGIGGAGGTGAAGGGGAGGVSVAVLYQGSTPILDAATTAKPGLKGGPGAGPDQNAGVDGMSAAMLEVK